MKKARINIISKLTLVSIILLVVFGCSKKDKTNTPMKSGFNLKKGTYNISNVESKLTWVGKQLSTKEHKGTMDSIKGEIIINSEGIINGIIEVDMNSINVTDLQGGPKSSLERHLKSSDFFNVKEFPAASIKFQENNKLSNTGISCDGQLTIKNITHPISFKVDILEANDNIKAKTTLTFDRSKYDVRFGSGKFFENLGDKLIYDNIDLSVLIVTG